MTKVAKIQQQQKHWSGEQFRPQYIEWHGKSDDSKLDDGCIHNSTDNITFKSAKMDLW